MTLTDKQKKRRAKLKNIMWWVGGLLTFGYTLKEGVERFIP